MRKLALIAAAIAVFTAALLYAVHRVTEAEPSARAAGPSDAPPPPATAPVLPAGGEPPARSYAEASPSEPIVIPPRPMPPTGPVQNATPPIEGPAPIPLPDDPAAKRQALDEVRRQRMMEQMERLDRRNRERLAESPPPSGPPPAPPRAPPSPSDKPSP